MDTDTAGIMVRDNTGAPLSVIRAFVTMRDLNWPRADLVARLI